MTTLEMHPEFIRSYCLLNVLWNFFEKSRLPHDPFEAMGWPDHDKSRPSKLTVIITLAYPGFQVVCQNQIAGKTVGKSRIEIEHLQEIVLFDTVQITIG